MVKHELPDAIRVTLIVTSELERLGVTHIVGGSLASSLHGVPRATNDADIVAAMREEHVDAFVHTLHSTFYVDADMIRDAIVQRAEFNVIELATMFKVDVFVPLMDIVTRAELRRGVATLVDAERNLTMRLATPEDIIVQKLSWYERGARISERQWTDALGVLMVQKNRLDLDYLRETAILLGVEKLLEQALEQSAATDL